MTTGSEPSAGTGLGALLAAIKRSPIVVRLSGGLAQVGIGRVAEGAVGQRATIA